MGLGAVWKSSNEFRVSKDDIEAANTLTKKSAQAFGVRHVCTISNGFWTQFFNSSIERLLISTRDCYFAAGYFLTVEWLSHSSKRVAPIRELPLGTRDCSSNFAPK
jgi:hypothetical protein